MLFKRTAIAKRPQAVVENTPELLRGPSVAGPGLSRPVRHRLPRAALGLQRSRIGGRSRRWSYSGRPSTAPPTTSGTRRRTRRSTQRLQCSSTFRQRRRERGAWTADSRATSAARGSRRLDESERRARRREEAHGESEPSRSARRWHRLYFLPLPHQHASLRPIFGSRLNGVGTDPVARPLALSNASQ